MRYTAATKSVHNYTDQEVAESLGDLVAKMWRQWPCASEVEIKWHQNTGFFSVSFDSKVETVSA